MSGCLGLLVSLPLKLILFPLRKLLNILGAVRNFSKDVAGTWLYSHALDRALTAGWLQLPGGAAGTRPKAAGQAPAAIAPEACAALASDARRVQEAFAIAERGTDLRILRSALDRALGGVKQLPAAALRSLRNLRRQPDDAELVVAAIDPRDREVLEAGSSRFQQAVQSDEVQHWLAGFDARFDAALKRNSP